MVYPIIFKTVLNLRECFEKYLIPEKCEACALWAFGEGFESIPVNDLFDRWNDIHGDLFELRSQGEVQKDIERIVEAWKNVND